MIQKISYPSSKSANAMLAALTPEAADAWRKVPFWYPAKSILVKAAVARDCSAADVWPNGPT